MTGSRPLIVVYGARGVVGEAVVRQLVAGGSVAIALAGRSGVGLTAMHAELARAGVPVQLRVAARDDAEGLTTLCAGAAVVIDASSAPTAAAHDPMILAALGAGAHYLDARSAATWARGAYEQHDRLARARGAVVCTGVGVEGALGDWLAAVTAAALVSGQVHRGDIADDDLEPTPVDGLATVVAYDDLTVSPGAQQSLGKLGGADGFRWRDGRWEPQALGAERRRFDVGGTRGVRLALCWPGAEVVTTPRHVAASAITTYRSFSTDDLGAGLAVSVARLAGPLARLGFGKRGGVLDQVMVAPTGGAAARARTTFVVQAEATLGAERRVARLTGRDPSATTGTLLALAAQHLARRTLGPVGALAPAEWWPAAEALVSIAAAAGLALSPPAAAG